MNPDGPTVVPATNDPRGSSGIHRAASNRAGSIIQSNKSDSKRPKPKLAVCCYSSLDRRNKAWLCIYGVAIKRAVEHKCIGIGKAVAL